MARARPFPRGLGEDTGYTQQLAPINVMKSYIKSKLVQRVSGPKHSFRGPHSVILCLCRLLMLKHYMALAWQMMRNLKTLPVSVISYGVSKTKNTLTARSKEEGGYDKDADPYRHMYENVHEEWSVGKATLEAIEQITAGQASDGRGRGQSSRQSHVDQGDNIAH